MIIGLYSSKSRGSRTWYHTINLANTTNEFKDLKSKTNQSNNAHKPLTNQIRDRVPTHDTKDFMDTTVQVRSNQQ